MVRIHSWVNQKRVLARDLRGRLLSIPEDYLIKFEVVGQQRKHSESIKPEFGLLRTMVLQQYNNITKAMVATRQVHRDV